MKSPIDKLYSPTERAIAEMVRKEIYLRDGKKMSLEDVWKSATK